MKPQNPIFQTLKNIGSQNRNRLFKTFSLVATENLLWATYPLLGSFAIGAIISGSLKGAFGYAVLMLIIYGVSASRRRVDTQTFTRIYAEIAVPVILKQREQGSSHSEIYDWGDCDVVGVRILDWFGDECAVWVGIVAADG